MNLERVLLVEDDSADIELTVEVFKELNIDNKLVIAHDGEEALDYIYKKGIYSERQNGNPLVILLDLKMPKHGGLEVLGQLKSDPEKKNIPIVILTSSCEPKDLDEAYKLGVNAYVVKPVLIGEFINAIKQLGIFWALINQPPADANTKI